MLFLEPLDGALARGARVFDGCKPGQNVWLNWFLEGRVKAASTVGLGAYYALIPFGIYGAVTLHRRGITLIPVLSTVVVVAAAAAPGVPIYTSSPGASSISFRVTPASHARSDPTGACGQPAPGSPRGSWSCTPKYVLGTPSPLAESDGEGAAHVVRHVSAPNPGDVTVLSEDVADPGRVPGDLVTQRSGRHGTPPAGTPPCSWPPDPSPPPPGPPRPCRCILGTAPLAPAEASTARFDDAAALLAEVVREPTFPEDEVERVRERQLAGLMQRRKDPRSLHPWREPRTGP